MLSTLQHLLTGRSVDELLVENGDDVGYRGGGERIVIRLSESLQRTLAEASVDDLHRVAQPWSETEEFWGQGDPAECEEMLTELAQLARQGLATNGRLYCWVCV